MKGKSQTIFFATLIAGIILLIEVLVGQFFPKVTFVNGSLTIANKIVSYLAVSCFLFGLLLFFRANRFVTAPVGLVLFLFLTINSCSEIYPIDTTTEPIDIALLYKDEIGNKLIAREYKNAKTNATIRDTVLVKDYFLFRELIDKKGNRVATNR